VPTAKKRKWEKKKATVEKVETGAGAITGRGRLLQ
jgi:hypothetical protein